MARVRKLVHRVQQQNMRNQELLQETESNKRTLELFQSGLEAALENKNSTAELEPECRLAIEAFAKHLGFPEEGLDRAAIDRYKTFLGSQNAPPTEGGFLPATDEIRQALVELDPTANNGGERSWTVEEVGHILLNLKQEVEATKRERTALEETNEGLRARLQSSETPIQTASTVSQVQTVLKGYETRIQVLQAEKDLIQTNASEEVKSLRQQIQSLAAELRNKEEEFERLQQVERNFEQTRSHMTLAEQEQVEQVQRLEEKTQELETEIATLRQVGKEQEIELARTQTLTQGAVSPELEGEEVGQEFEGNSTQRKSIETLENTIQDLQEQNGVIGKLLDVIQLRHGLELSDVEKLLMLHASDFEVETPSREHQYKLCDQYVGSRLPKLEEVGDSTGLIPLLHMSLGECRGPMFATSTQELQWIEQVLMPYLNDGAGEEKGTLYNQELEPTVLPMVTGQVLALYSYLGKIVGSENRSSLDFAIAAGTFCNLSQRFTFRDPIQWKRLLNSLIRSFGERPVPRLQMAAMVQLACVTLGEEATRELLGKVVGSLMDSHRIDRESSMMDILEKLFEDDGIDKNNCSFTVHQHGHAICVVWDGNEELIFARKDEEHGWICSSLWDRFERSEGSKRFSAAWGSDGNHRVSWVLNDGSTIARYMLRVHGDQLRRCIWPLLDPWDRDSL